MLRLAVYQKISARYTVHTDRQKKSCYFFIWINLSIPGGALKLLGASGCVDWNQILEFVLSTHCPETGGKTNFVERYI